MPDHFHPTVSRIVQTADYRVSIRYIILDITCFIEFSYRPQIFQYSLTLTLHFRCPVMFAGLPAVTFSTPRTSELRNVQISLDAVMITVHQSS